MENSEWLRKIFFFFCLLPASRSLHRLIKSNTLLVCMCLMAEHMQKTFHPKICGSACQPSYTWFTFPTLKIPCKLKGIMLKKKKQWTPWYYGFPKEQEEGNEREKKNGFQYVGFLRIVGVSVRKLREKFSSFSLWNCCCFNFFFTLLPFSCALSFLWRLVDVNVCSIGRYTTTCMVCPYRGQSLLSSVKMWMSFGA